MIYDKEKFFYSVKRSIPILIGYFPVGMAYGILMANAGYQFGWSVIVSMFVYTGSLQMLMVSFLVNQIPLMTVAVTALLLNSRHIFYGLSFIEKFREYGIWKYFLIYGLTDENYSLLCSYKETDGVNEKWVHIFFNDSALGLLDYILRNRRSGEISWKYFTGCSDGNFGYLLPSCC